MHSRDTTVLIDLLWFNVVHYSSLFTRVPILFENAKILVYLLVNFVWKHLKYNKEPDPGGLKGSMEPPFFDRP